MWDELWSDFELRAARLERPGATPADAVDVTILWQLQGIERYVPAIIPAAHLHLPELYSGSPWMHRERWIAYVTTNPSIDPDEVFPTRADLTRHGSAELRAFFAQRFEPGRRDEPLVHGRVGRGPTRWVNRNEPRACGQATWARADRALRACLQVPHQAPLMAPLGHVAAIVDAVPWKFKNWKHVPEKLKDELLECGRRYLETTLKTHTPAVIVAAGEHVRKLMYKLYPMLPQYETKTEQSGEIKIGKQQVRWFGVAAPTGKGRLFYEQMERITPEIRQAMGIEEPAGRDH